MLKYGKYGLTVGNKNDIKCILLAFAKQFSSVGSSIHSGVANEGHSFKSKPQL